MMNQHLYKPLHTPYNNMKIYHFGLSEFCPKKGKYSKISTYLFSPRGIKKNIWLSKILSVLKSTFCFFWANAIAASQNCQVLQLIEDSLKCNIFCLPLEIVFRTKATKHCNKSAHFKHNNLEEVQWLMTIFTSANKWESFEDLLWYSTWTKSTLGDKKVSNLLSLHKKDNLFYYLTHKHIVVNLIYI